MFFLDSIVKSARLFWQAAFPFFYAAIIKAQVMLERIPFFDQQARLTDVTPGEMDRLWERGWRHFGVDFYRYTVDFDGEGVRLVMPLRVDLEKFSPSRSQRRILAKNRDVRVVVRESFIDRVKEDLFERHKQRFKERAPDSIYTFLSATPASVPCRNREICAYLGGRLIAASFLDVGERATSAVCAMFEPAESKRSLGIFTMLEAIRYSWERGCRYYYPGYAYHQPSVYDYKKNFRGLEYLDWRDGWRVYDSSPRREAG